jgi:hypothetical protein
MFSFHSWYGCLPSTQFLIGAVQFRASEAQRGRRGDGGLGAEDDWHSPVQIALITLDTCVVFVSTGSMAAVVGAFGYDRRTLKLGSGVFCPQIYADGRR